MTLAGGLIHPYKGRTVAVGDKVRVYRNLHRKDWSIVALTGPYKGLVVAHADAAPVWGPRFIVGEKGRQRVIREGRKNVHAFIEGTLGGYIPTGALVKIRHAVAYNPFRFPTFMVFPRADGGVGRVDEVQPIHRGGLAVVDEDGKAWVWAPRNAA